MNQVKNTFDKFADVIFMNQYAPMLIYRIAFGRKSILIRKLSRNRWNGVWWMFILSRDVVVVLEVFNVLEMINVLKVAGNLAMVIISPMIII